MHLLRVQRPNPRLCRWIRAYAQREFNSGLEAVTELCPARLEQDLEFQFADPFVVTHVDRPPSMVTAPVTIVGAYTRGGAGIRLTGRVETFAVFFHPTGFSRLFRVPAAHLSNGDHDATSIVRQLLNRWWEQLAEARSFKDRVYISERAIANCPRCRS
jgi:hypothetical protein